MNEQELDKVRRLVRWDSTDPTSMVDQLAERVRSQLRKGHAVGVVYCLVWQEETPGNHYEVACSSLPVEVILMVAELLRDKARER